MKSFLSHIPVHAMVHFTTFLFIISHIIFCPRWYVYSHHTHTLYLLPYLWIALWCSPLVITVMLFVWLIISYLSYLLQKSISFFSTHGTLFTSHTLYWLFVVHFMLRGRSYLISNQCLSLVLLLFSHMSYFNQFCSRYRYASEASPNESVFSARFYLSHLRHFCSLYSYLMYVDQRVGSFVNHHKPDVCVAAGTHHSVSGFLIHHVVRVHRFVRHVGHRLRGLI